MGKLNTIFGSLICTRRGARAVPAGGKMKTMLFRESLGLLALTIYGSPAGNVFTGTEAEEPS